jgi:hypothetical protein
MSNSGERANGDGTWSHRQRPDPRDGRPHEAHQPGDVKHVLDAFADGLQDDREGG